MYARSHLAVGTVWHCVGEWLLSYRALCKVACYVSGGGGNDHGVGLRHGLFTMNALECGSKMPSSHVYQWRTRLKTH